MKMLLALLMVSGAVHGAQNMKDVRRQAVQRDFWGRPAEDGTVPSRKLSDGLINHAATRQAKEARARKEREDKLRMALQNRTSMKEGRGKIADDMDMSETTRWTPEELAKIVDAAMQKTGKGDSANSQEEIPISTPVELALRKSCLEQLQEQSRHHRTLSTHSRAKQTESARAVLDKDGDNAGVRSLEINHVQKAISQLVLSVHALQLETLSGEDKLYLKQYVAQLEPILPDLKALANQPSRVAPRKGSEARPESKAGSPAS